MQESRSRGTAEQVLVESGRNELNGHCAVAGPPLFL
jgi:hypothetical protein